MTWKPARAIEDMRPLDPTPKMRTMSPGVGDFDRTSVDERVWCDASGSEQHFKGTELDIGNAWDLLLRLGQVGWGKVVHGQGKAVLNTRVVVCHMRHCVSQT